MANNNNWISLSGDVWEHEWNWSLGTVPTYDDDVIFSSGLSNYNCTATTDIVCNSIVVSGTYGGNISWAGKSLSTSGDFIDDGTGTRNLGSGIIMNGNSATLHLGSTLGTVTATSCVLYMNGTTGMTFDIDKATTFNRLVLGNSVVLSSTGSAASTFISASVPLTMGTNCTFSNTPAIFFRRTTSGDIHQTGAGSIISGVNIQFPIGAAGIACTFPTLTVTGATSQIYLNDAGNYTPGSSITLTGDLIMPTNVTSVLNCLSASTSILTIDFDIYNVTCGTLKLRGYVSATGADQRLYLGSGTHNITSLSSTSTTSTKETLFLESSVINCSGSITFWSGLNVDPGTSKVNITNSSSITSNGKAFYDLYETMASSRTVMLFIDDPIISGNFVVTEGSSTWTGRTLTCYQDVTIDGTGTHNFGTGITMNGNSATLHIGSTVGTVTGSSCVLTMNTVTAGVIDIDKLIICKELILGNSSKVTTTSSALCTFSTTGVPLTIGTNCIFAMGNLIFIRTTSGPLHSIGAGTTMTLPGAVFFKTGADGIACTFPAFTYTGIGTLSIWDNAAFATGTSITLTGDLNCGTATLYLTSSNTSIYTFNAAGYNITCGVFGLRGFVTAAGANIRLYMGSGTHTITSFGGISMTSTKETLYLETCTINCGGSITFWSGLTVDPGTSLVTVTNTSTVTSNGKAFYDLYINTPSSGNIVTFADSPLISGNFNVIEGSTNFSNLIWSGYGDILFDGSGSHTIGSGLTLNGPNKTFRLNNTLTNVISAGCYVQALDDTTFNLNTRTINRLSLFTGKTYTWTAGPEILAINNYTDEDWDGATFISSSPGTQWGLNMVPSITVLNMNITDSDNSTGYEINALDISNINGGNNLGWDFYVIPPISATGNDKTLLVLTNQRVTPYKKNSQDILKIKAQLFENQKKKMVYAQNIPLSLYLNYPSGEFIEYETGVTNRYGAQQLTHSCSGILVNNCLGYAKTTINDTIITSNIIRFNFKESIIGSSIDFIIQLIDVPSYQWPPNTSFQGYPILLKDQSTGATSWKWEVWGATAGGDFLPGEFEYLMTLTSQDVECDFSFSYLPEYELDGKWKLYVNGRWYKFKLTINNDEELSMWSDPINSWYPY